MTGAGQRHPIASILGWAHLRQICDPESNHHIVRWFSLSAQTAINRITTMTGRSLSLTAAFALTTLIAQPFQSSPTQAASDQEYCITGAESKLVRMRAKASESSEEAGLARGGDCGMGLMRCQGDWCKMQMHDFEAWVKKADLRKK